MLVVEAELLRLDASESLLWDSASSRPEYSSRWTDTEAEEGDNRKAMVSPIAIK